MYNRVFGKWEREAQIIIQKTGEMRERARRMGLMWFLGIFMVRGSRGIE
jgi:hypothetical protein